MSTGEKQTRFTPRIDEVRNSILGKQDQLQAGAPPLGEDDDEKISTPITADMLSFVADSSPDPDPAVTPETEASPAVGDEVDEPEGQFANTSYDNKKVRTHVEAQLKGLSFSELVRTGKLRQRVPVCDGLVIDLQSISAKDELFITEQAFRAASVDAANGVTYTKVYTLMEMTIGIVSINGIQLPEYLEMDGSPNVDKFTTRWKTLADYGTELLEPLHCNLRWFQERSRSMTVPSQLKNG